MDYLAALKLANPAEVRDLTPAELLVATRWDPKVLRTYLVAHARLQGRALQITTGNFGDLLLQLEPLRQAPGNAPMLLILDEEDFLPGSSLRSDAHLTRSVIETARNEAGLVLERLISLIRELASGRTVVILPPCLPTFPLLPAPEGTASVAGRLPHQIHLALFDLQASLPRQIHILDPRVLGKDLSPAQWRDDRLLFSGGWPFSKAATDRIAEASTFLLFHPGESKKILITDADHTLWQGIVGDDGVEALSWAQEPDTYRFLIYQKTLNLLISEGILVAVASKNSPENLAAALRRKDLVLDAPKISAQEASWEPKSAMIRRILESVNLLPSAAVFVDDSEFELGEVQQALPGVTCLRFPPDNLQLREFFQKLRGFFDTRVLSKEDAGRAGSLHHTQQFQRNLQDAYGAETYLATLQMRARIEPVPPQASERAFQLLNKTNQFNLCGRRWELPEWNAMLQRKDRFAWQLSFQDRQCDYGIVSILLADDRGCVTDWVLSCRVFSRTIEHYFLSHVLAELKSRGIRELRLHFKDTGKNHAIRTFLDQVARPETGGGRDPSWRFAGHQAATPLISPIRGETQPP